MFAQQPTLVPVEEIFSISYGVNLELIEMEPCKPSEAFAVPFVSRTSKNNGIAAFVRFDPQLRLNDGNTLSVAVSGSVLSTFYQDRPYYSGFHVFVLKPRRDLSIGEFLFYAKCIENNRYRYCYGRQANRTLAQVLIPKRLPRNFGVHLDKLFSIEINRLSKKPITNLGISLTGKPWKPFKLGDLFFVRKGKRLVKEKLREGLNPFVASIDSNNGIRQYVKHAPIHQGNTISVNYNGSVAEAFYQPMPYWASDDVNVLYPKFALDAVLAMFLVTVIRNEKYRFNYGRKWNIERMKESKIYLPVDTGNRPDWSFMRDYVSSLPYSGNLDQASVGEAQLV